MADQHESDADEPEALAAAADELYSLEPDAFLDRRRELVAQARADGDPDAARAIGALRKPTLAAWVVNVGARQDLSCVDRLLDLNERLRAAHEDLDATALRDLSGERRALVGRLAADALTAAGREEASTSLRDDVVSTFDAAVADPSVAGRLGRLPRAEHWSGFGVAAPEGPVLRVVRGGRGGGRTGSRREPPSARPATVSDRPSGPSRQVARALEKARAALDTAESALAEADGGESTARAELERLTGELADLQERITDARGRLEQARREAKAARSRRREARSALDRAERRAQG